MRTIKFRAQVMFPEGGIVLSCDKAEGEWVYGDLHLQSRIPHIHSLGKKYPINPGTVGQFTGLYDKDGNEIYEWDILGRKDGGALLKVEFRHGAFGYEYCGEFHSWAGNHNFTFNPFDTDVDFAIIGNIYDNPELLK